MVLTMYVAVEDCPAADERVLGIAVDQSLLAGELGYNPWFTEHHFRGSWHSSPIQFASFIAPQIPKDRYLGFGVLSIPYYHPVRLVESMNQLDQLTKGHTLYGLGSGFAGIEPPGSVSMSIIIVRAAPPKTPSRSCSGSGNSVPAIPNMCSRPTPIAARSSGA